MKDEQDTILQEFDDSEAIKFILARLPETDRKQISDDDVQYSLDLICDYYEENNLFSEEDDNEVSEASIAEDDMFQYVRGLMLEEKEVSLTDAQLHAILDGEYAYGVSIGIYEPED